MADIAMCARDLVGDILDDVAAFNVVDSSGLEAVLSGGREHGCQIRVLYTLEPIGANAPEQRQL